MKSRSRFGCLGALAAIYMAMIIIMPIVSIYHPPIWPLRLLAVLFTPFIFTMPVAPPIVFALIFDQIGSDKAKLKRASRALSGAILALAMMYMSFAFAMAGRFEIFWNTDELIFLAMLTISGSLAIFGFRPVRRICHHQFEPVQ